jgi:hypothetical protein
VSLPDGMIRLKVTNEREHWEPVISCGDKAYPHERHGDHMCVTVPKEHAPPLLHAGYAICDADDC